MWPCLKSASLPTQNPPHTPDSNLQGCLGRLPRLHALNDISLSCAQVHYPASLGRALHAAPVFLLAGAAVLVGVRSGNSLGSATGQLARALALAVGSLICGCILPAAVGIVRVLLSGMPYFACVSSPSSPSHFFLTHVSCGIAIGKGKVIKQAGPEYMCVYVCVTE